MTVGAGISVSDGKLNVFGTPVLTHVHDNVVVTSSSDDGMIDGGFIGVRSDQTGSRMVFPVGKLDRKWGLRFMCVFRFKLWWMTQRMGTCGQDIPTETQFLIVETREGSHFGEDNVVDDGCHQSALYTVFLPILEGDFRAVIQGNSNNELEIVLESGDPDVKDFEGSHLVFVAAGSDPFDAITNAVKSVERHLQTFAHRERKKMPDMLNWFGWCTWDAFYTEVTSEGVKQGLESFEKGGVSPKFVIIDDGWQSVDMDPTSFEAKADNTANFTNRLTHIKENHKFQKDGKEGHRVEDPAMGLRHVVTDIKDQHNLKYVYVWHAITGYWGGVRPGVAEMDHYNSKLSFPVSSPGAESNEICDALKAITKNGLGLVDPEKVFSFYNELHSYLASAGIDGVKVDVQNILETLGAGHGGRVKLTRKYHQALEASISRNFHDNGIISCMSHNTDGLYSTKRTAVIRASDDFWPHVTPSHTVHIASVAYNTIFLGEFMQPDWDMFHSLHPMAEYHGAARAVGGCAIYVSDKPGHHDFNLLKKLVLPDGSILRAKLPGRPTRDCLFTDPTRDGKSTAVIRASDDFWPHVTPSHTVHIASVAYNTIFLGEFMQPDWDMFHSLHPMAEYHGAARAVGGCAIYVSDKPGHHDFNLLKKLVLPDGSILRAKLPGRPTRDCLFTDPTRDGKSLLKIWNLNNFTGVVGVFNCQGAGWCKDGKTMLTHDEEPPTITGFIRAKDVNNLPKVADSTWSGDAVVYSQIGGELVYLQKNASIPVTLKSREYEVFTVVPVKKLSSGVSFAPIGLIKMFNSGGAIVELNCEMEKQGTVELKVRGCGTFGAFSSKRPVRVTIDTKETGFRYEEGTGLISIELSVPEKEMYLWDIIIEV
ncbi:seed imbibition 1 [Artemisia annua]|uniref:galactinol--sucrose galactosyltransferase n=1 Tax=Artemisia annua TaxID=35608 RepID=A0A2U1N346_ARTAN|nr:seed imbibition 1 [Artemisia annua]